MTLKHPDEDTQSSGAVIAIENLQKRYGNVVALDGLHLNVGAGEVYGFLGRNGAGKSTTIRIATGITPPNDGTVKLFGQGMAPSDPQARQRIGYVAQEQNFYGWMTPESIGRFVKAFFPTWDDAEYDRLCKSLDLPISRKIQVFSGGMRAKMALALALAHRPPLLILDEPMAGLDPIARREFIAIVRQQAESSGRTTFFSSHLVDEVEEAADRIGIVEKGRMLFQGSLESLLCRVRKLKLRNLSEEEARAQGRPLMGLGVRILTDEMHKGTRELIIWSKSPEELGKTQARIDASPWEVENLNLEDAFVALVSRRVF